MAKSEKSFKQLEEELDVIMVRVESAEYEEIDELLRDYQTGKKLITELEKRLTEAKNSVKKVSEK